MNKMEPFKRAFARAKERKAKQQQTKVEKVDSNTTNTITTVITATQLDRDEQYRTTIIQKMLNHIKQKRK